MITVAHRLSLACSPEQVDVLRGKFARNSASGFKCDLLEDSAAIKAVEPNLAVASADERAERMAKRDETPGSVLAATHTPLSGHVNPSLAARALACEAVKAGAKLRERCEALRIVQRSNVLTSPAREEEEEVFALAPTDAYAYAVDVIPEGNSGGDSGGIERIYAKHVVVAAGAWSGPLLLRSRLRWRLNPGLVESKVKEGRDARLFPPPLFGSGPAWIPVYPVRGSIWQTEQSPAEASLRGVIFTNEAHTMFMKEQEKDRRRSPSSTSSLPPLPPRPARTAAERSSFFLRSVPRYVTHDGEGNPRPGRHAYGRRRADGRIIFGGGRVPLPVAWRHGGEGYEADLQSKETADSVAMVREFWPKPSLPNFDRDSREEKGEEKEKLGRENAVPIEGVWAGIMPFSLDGMPLVGEIVAPQLSPTLAKTTNTSTATASATATTNERLLDCPGLWSLTGFGPHGIMEGPMSACILAAAVSSRLLAETGRKQEQHRAVPAPEEVQGAWTQRSLEKRAARALRELHPLRSGAGAVAVQEVDVSGFLG